MSVSMRPSVAVKIGIVSTSFSIPIAVLLFLVVTNINEFIHFGVWEKSGIAYLRPLEELLCNLQNHQILMHSSDGSQSTEQKTTSIRFAVERAITRLETVNRRHGKDLGFTDEGLSRRNREHLQISTLRQHWKKLVETVTAGPLSEKVLADMDDCQMQLVSDVRGMITHAGDTSNLILDPDLDSYYLVDVTLLVLPQFQERISRVTNYGLDVIRRGGPTQEERIQLAIYAAMLQESDLERIVSSTKTSLSEDSNFHGTSKSLHAHLPSVLNTFETWTRDFIGMTEHLAKSELSEVSATDYVAAGSNALDASFQFWNVAESELNRLLDVRINAYRKRRNWSLVLAGVAVLTACLLARIATRSIAQPLSILVHRLGPGASLLRASIDLITEMDQKEHKASQEASGITSQLNAYAEEMRKTVDELETLVKGVDLMPNKPNRKMTSHAENSVTYFPRPS